MKYTNLQDRFLKPTHWHQVKIQNPTTNHTINYAHNISQNNNRPLIVCLPGLSEFCEKYYETANFFINNGYNILVIDWAYQGRSTRLSSNPHKRHSDGYDSDINDLKLILDKNITQNTPLFMLGHSMGGHIGLRFLSQYPDYFQAASFSAPMLGIKDLKYTGWLVRLFAPFFRFFQTSYIPKGQNWRVSARKSDGTDIFSSDPLRDTIHNIWCSHDPALQVGNPTVKWILESLKSIAFLKKNLKKIKTPILIGMAEKEEIICNDAIKTATKKIPNAKILSLKNAKHEIIMETDNIRDEFLNETLTLFRQSN